MEYISYQDMANVIRRNLWKIPTDIDAIVGVPRSGMIAALMIAELTNKPFSDLDSFIEGRIISSGKRSRLMKDQSGKVEKVLVIDDTCYAGRAISEAKEKVGSLCEKYHILYGCVFAEGRNAKNHVDIYLEENYKPGENMYLYEWNILHHYDKKTKVSMWDIDGLLCKDPPSDVDTKVYEEYLKNPLPMIIPTTFIGAFVTYRLDKYRSLTEDFLKKQGITYGHLYMTGFNDRETRNATISPSKFKARIYKESEWAKLFVESDRRQAEKIHKLSGKPVFCYENGMMYID